MMFVTHGEPDAADALRVAIERKLGRPARIPEYLESFDLQ
jgi:metallo-beta-lactamase family protein